jgi:hypothetical protein
MNARGTVNLVSHCFEMQVVVESAQSFRSVGLHNFSVGISH